MKSLPLVESPENDNILSAESKQGWSRLTAHLADQEVGGRNYCVLKKKRRVVRPREMNPDRGRWRLPKRQWHSLGQPRG
jgi:hypothetical protein